MNTNSHAYSIERSKLKPRVGLKVSYFFLSIFLLRPFLIPSFLPSFFPTLIPFFIHPFIHSICQSFISFVLTSIYYFPFRPTPAASSGRLISTQMPVAPGGHGEVRSLRTFRPGLPVESIPHTTVFTSIPLLDIGQRTTACNAWATSASVPSI